MCKSYENNKKIINSVSQLQLEEQRALLNDLRKTTYLEASQVYIPEQISHLFPDPADLADQTWNMFVDSLAEHGYKIPSEWKELQ